MLTFVDLHCMLPLFLHSVWHFLKKLASYLQLSYTETMRESVGTLIAIVLAFGAVAVSSVSLWLAVQARQADQEIVSQVQQVVDTRDTVAEDNTVKELQVIVEQLRSDVASLSASVAAQPKTTTRAAATTQANTNAQVKEYFVYLGTGSSTNLSWTDIDSAAATIDTSQYGSIKSVSLEATLSIISGEVSARLKNKTTGAIFHLSEVMHNTSTSQWRTSQTFQLPSGAQQYVVQVRSSNGEIARLDGSRLKIVVQ